MYLILNPRPLFFRNEEVSEDTIASDYFVGCRFNGYSGQMPGKAPVNCGLQPVFLKIAWKTSRYFEAISGFLTKTPIVTGGIPVRTVKPGVSCRIPVCFPGNPLRLIDWSATGMFAG